MRRRLPRVRNLLEADHSLEGAAVSRSLLPPAPSFLPLGVVLVRAPIGVIKCRDQGNIQLGLMVSEGQIPGWHGDGMMTGTFQNSWLDGSSSRKQKKSTLGMAQVF